MNMNLKCKIFEQEAYFENHNYKGRKPADFFFNNWDKTNIQIHHIECLANSEGECASIVVFYYELENK